MGHPSAAFAAVVLESVFPSVAQGLFQEEAPKAGTSSQTQALQVKRQP